MTNNGINGEGCAGAPPVRVPDFAVSTLAGRKVVILGLARQGSALARFCIAAGAKVVISDAAPAERLRAELQALGALPVDLILGEHPLSLLDECTLLCLSGGVPPQIPLVQEALARGIPLSNDSLLTFQAAAHFGLGPILGITGSSGKTTTTTLVGHILTAAGLRPHVGGNIGRPLIDQLAHIHPGEPLVMELSSFQLELFDPQIAWGSFTEIGPQIAVITNLTPNHLDRHPSMADYAHAKLNLLRCMPPGATLIVNADDPVTSRLLPPLKGHRRKKLPADWRLDDMLAEMRAELVARGTRFVPISRLAPLDEGAWLDGTTLVVNGEPVIDRSEAHLRGDHNVSNLLTAFALAHAAGADVHAMRSTACSFTGVAHRLEVVAEANGVTWINDSIATSPERAVAGMRSFDPARQTLILLAGGKDKKLPWDAFAGEVVARVSYLIGFGHSGPMIVQAVQERARFSQQKAPNCAVVQRLDEAVVLAKRIAGPNSVVLLSPGGTSYDAYKDFEERGEHFRQLVLQQVGTDANGTTPAGAPTTVTDSATEEKSE
jgi:UDP-N-acetylmuramoylalanine--D-glutamate ligase